MSFQIAERTLLEDPINLSKRGAYAQSSCFVSGTDQSAAFGLVFWTPFPFDNDFPLDDSWSAVATVGAENCTC